MRLQVYATLHIKHPWMPPPDPRSERWYSVPTYSEADLLRSTEILQSGLPYWSRAIRFLAGALRMPNVFPPETFYVEYP